MLRQTIPLLLGLLAAGCAGEAPQPATPRPSTQSTPAATDAQAPAAGVGDPAPGTAAADDAASDDLNSIPAATCAPEVYREFVNAFAQFVPQRARFVTATGRTQLAEFDVALVDYRWQRASDGVALELDMQRRDARLDVTATPVERDADDQPVRTLGPARRYAFEHREGCWRYAGVS